mmetsp:Transcript_88915/g.254198  ORF Transcript_88915/g.254198 Transcript_88915/m.254198 type:complete len:230 (-) Transcript_88915:26-715(-)
MTIAPLAVAWMYGANVGDGVGSVDGAGLGGVVGLGVGNEVGDRLGIGLGRAVGLTDGTLVDGLRVGATLGSALGALVRTSTKACPPLLYDVLLAIMMPPSNPSPSSSDVACRTNMMLANSSTTAKVHRQKRCLVLRRCFTFTKCSVPSMLVAACWSVSPAFCPSGSSWPKTFPSLSTETGLASRPAWRGCTFMLVRQGLLALLAQTLTRSALPTLAPRSSYAWGLAAVL